MAVTERMRETIAPVMAELEVELVDVELVGATVRVVIDRPGGVDLEVISRATRRISHLLDEDDPLADRYTLEVSSPGLERPLRLPAHFARAVDATISVKTAPGVDGERRLTGRLLSAGDDAIEVEVSTAPEGRRRIRYDDIEKARTVFEWGPAPKPGGGPGKAWAPKSANQHTDKSNNKKKNKDKKAAST